MAVITEFKWKLDNFVRRFINDRENDFSQIFSLNEKPEAKFRVCVYAGNEFCLDCDEIGQTGGELKLVCKFWVENGGNKIFECVKAYVFPESDFSSDAFLTEFDLIELQKSIVGDSITLCVKIKLGEPVIDFDQLEMTFTKISPLEQLALNIGKLRFEGHHDLTIQAGGKEFKAFKNVLMSHSEIFKVMLSSPNSIEARDNLIKIEDTDANIIEVLVNWMHHLKVDNLNELALDLYKVAHKYHISPLMDLCVQVMSNTLTVENLPSRVILAYIYQVKELKRAIFKFVRQARKNAQNLIASDEWIDFICENRELAKKIAKELSK